MPGSFALRVSTIAVTLALVARTIRELKVGDGIIRACQQQGIPYVLAGSIRDDGPLPETQMDLIRAQEEYARLLKGADLILMLASMLHSIGVGNMTPAGVRLVCVDINPAVVTKLADRGLYPHLEISDTGFVFWAPEGTRYRTKSKPQ